MAMNQAVTQTPAAIGLVAADLRIVTANPLLATQAMQILAQDLPIPDGMRAANAIASLPRQPHASIRIPIIWIKQNIPAQTVPHQLQRHTAAYPSTLHIPKARQHSLPRPPLVMSCSRGTISIRVNRSTKLNGKLERDLG